MDIENEKQQVAATDIIEIDNQNISGVNIGLIELGKQNIKVYRDDPETIRNIKEHNKYYEEIIEKSLEILEENYQKHQIRLSRLSMYEENEDEQKNWNIRLC